MQVADRDGRRSSRLAAEVWTQFCVARQGQAHCIVYCKLCTVYCKLSMSCKLQHVLQLQQGQKLQQVQKLQKRAHCN